MYTYIHTYIHKYIYIYMYMYTYIYDQIYKKDQICQNIFDLICEQATVKALQTSLFCLHTFAIYA